jgi:Fic family protein
LEAAKDRRDDRDGAYEVVNYIAAMKYALDRLRTLPLSLRLIKETHAILLRQGRGSTKDPGEFRTSQNWIGPPGSTLTTASYIPPTVDDMKQAMGSLESYLHSSNGLPVLIKIALIHAQFETIHPFLDGNGRMGRLLIAFWLIEQGILSQPLLYLSYYFKLNRSEYYERLMNVRMKGDWEGWVRFFLEGVAFVSDEAVESAREIIELKDGASKALSVRHPSSSNHQRFLDLLFDSPLVSRKEVKDALGVSLPTAGSLVIDFIAEGILTDLTPDRTRNKAFIFSGYMDILTRGTRQREP